MRTDIELSFNNLWLESCTGCLLGILEISLGDKIFATIITNEVVEVDSKDDDAKEFFSSEVIVKKVLKKLWLESWLGVKCYGLRRKVTPIAIFP